MPKRKPFRVPERIVTLFFDDGPYAGLEVRVSLTAPMGLFWKIAAFEEGEATPEDIRDAMRLFGGQVRGWNLEGQDGAPIPVTPDAFADNLDQTTQAFLVAEWLKATRSPPESLSPGPRKRRTSARE